MTRPGMKRLNHTRKISYRKPVAPKKFGYSTIGKPHNLPRLCCPLAARVDFRSQAFQNVLLGLNKIDESAAAIDIVDNPISVAAAANVEAFKQQQEKVFAAALAAEEQANKGKGDALKAEKAKEEAIEANIAAKKAQIAAAFAAQTAAINVSNLKK